jgi:DNA transformation protein
MDGILVAVMADDSFKDFVLDQLSAAPEVRAKAMFGGHGLYHRDRFFGILMDGRLYFKTDERTRGAFLERGMGPFVYEKARRTMTMTYFEVPPEVLEDREELVAWVNGAVQAARPQRPRPSARASKSRTGPARASRRIAGPAA